MTVNGAQKESTVSDEAWTSQLGTANKAFFVLGRVFYRLVDSVQVTS